MGKRRAVVSSAAAAAGPCISLPPISMKCSSAVFSKPLYGDTLFAVEGLVTSDECSQLMQVAESIGFQHQSSRGAAFGEAFRDNGRIALHDPTFADSLWSKAGLSTLCCELHFEGKQAVGLNPNIRLYRYTVGQKFGRHVDESVQLRDGEVTGYTLLLYLNSANVKMRKTSSDTNLGGGETVFYGDSGGKVHTVVPKCGMVLLHLHGDECLEHEAAVVQSGTKYILRSDVVFKAT